MPFIGVAPFEPDAPDVPSLASDRIENVIPVNKSSYGPMASFAPYASALNARCQGALSMVDNDRNVRIFAGTASKLYRFAPPGTTPADVSKAGTYITGDSNWSMCAFGTRVIATNYNDPPQSYVEGSSALFADMITTGETSVKAKFVAPVRDFVVLGYTNHATYGKCPQRVWWSAVNNPSNFPTPGTAAANTALSDFQDVVGDHGALMGLTGNLGTAHCGIFFERAVYRMNYAGLPAIFDFQAVEGARGLLASGGLLQYGAVAYYLGEDGFYAFNGSSSTPIGKGRIDNFIYQDMRSDYLDRISCAANPATGLLYWAYAGAGSSNGICNRLLVYSPAYDKWTISDATSYQIQWLFRAATFGKTLEQLDAFGTMDSLPYSLDSQVWMGGRSALGGFDSANKMGYFEGSTLPAIVDTGDLEVVDGAQSTVSRIRPAIDLVAPQVAGCGRGRISENKVFSSYKSLESNGTASIRTRGRYHRYRIKTAAGDNWTQCSGINIEDYSKMGKR